MEYLSGGDREIDKICRELGLSYQVPANAGDKYMVSRQTKGSEPAELQLVGTRAEVVACIAGYAAATRRYGLDRLALKAKIIELAREM